MSFRARLLLYVAVFCCFAPLGLLTSITNLHVVPWREVVVITLFSGGIAVVFAITATLRPRLMPIPIVLHLVITGLMTYWLPDRPAVESLDPEAVDLLRTRLTTIAALVLACGISAFVFFWTAIRREGLRFTEAHAEIRLARALHGSLVPTIDGRRGALQWRGSSQPSGDVGGDLVDGLELPGGLLATVADVSGHGVAAGVLMGMYKTAFRSAATHTSDPGVLLTEVNSTMNALRQPHMFITGACLTVEDAGRVRYVLAGHPSMLLLSAATGRASWVGESQLALTLLDGVQYAADETCLEPGDTLIVITDGLLEVFNWKDQELGADGLRLVVENFGSRAPLSSLEAAIFGACRQHGAQTDDQTVLLVRRDSGEDAPR